MKLLSINLARSIWLGQILDFNPKGIKLDNVLSLFLLETYRFKNYPPLTEIWDLSKGIVFGEGEFKIDGEHPINVNLTLYNDGIIADTRSSTYDSDAFLDDAFNRFAEVFKSPTLQSIVSENLYLSQVYISTDKTIETLNPKLKRISKFLMQNVGGAINYQTGGVSFWADQTSTRKPGPFTFERTVNVPFSDNRYYSAAPLQTDKHLELLDELERILS